MYAMKDVRQSALPGRRVWRFAHADGAVLKHNSKGSNNNCRDGILEYYWGEHIHLGYYTEEERAQGYKKKDFKQAKFDFVDEMLRWSGASSPSRILDVGCGIGGTSRHLAAKFPSAQVQGERCRCMLLVTADYAPAQRFAFPAAVTRTSLLCDEI